MGKERRKLEAVSKGAVNLLHSQQWEDVHEHPPQGEGAHDKDAEDGGHDNTIDATPSQTEAKEAEGEGAHDKDAEDGGHDNTVDATPSQTEAKEAEGVVSGFVPNPTVMLVRLATSGVVVPVIQVRAYLFRRGMAVRVYRAFDGWRLK